MRYTAKTLVWEDEVGMMYIRFNGKELVFGPGGCSLEKGIHWTQPGKHSRRVYIPHNLLDNLAEKVERFHSEGGDEERSSDTSISEDERDLARQATAQGANLTNYWQNQKN